MHIAELSSDRLTSVQALKVGNFIAKNKSIDHIQTLGRNRTLSHCNRRKVPSQQATALIIKTQLSSSRHSRRSPQLDLRSRSDTRGGFHGCSLYHAATRAPILLA